VFTVVPGAVIQGTTIPNKSVSVSTEVTVQDLSFTYEQTTTANENGQYAIRVAQPGTYQMPNGSVHVNASAVRNGSTVSAA
jgi:dolichyl-diphosphooligosaccharide--protein glycosyltransferase